jgi:hypothetical protein
MLSRPRMAAAAAPTTRKPVRAIMVMAFDRLVSLCERLELEIYGGPGRVSVSFSRQRGRK